MESRNWLELPSEITSMILKKLDSLDVLAQTQFVCSSWRKICKDPLMWRVIDTHEFGYWAGNDPNLKMLYNRAIDLSCGQLVDINIEHFGSDEFLRYITHSSKQLRILRIVSCKRISDEGLIAAVSKLTLLEHLEIFDCSFDVETLKMVGKCCPLLKLFKLNKKWWTGLSVACDKEALAIAESMPKLQHLEIFWNYLTNEGLKAILNGCPHLEFLDIRECLNLDLNSQLGKDCVRRIKNVLKGSNYYTSSDHYDSCFRSDKKAFSMYRHMNGLEDEDEDFDDFDPFYQRLNARDRVNSLFCWD